MLAVPNALSAFAPYVRHFVVNPLMVTPHVLIVTITVTLTPNTPENVRQLIKLSLIEQVRGQELSQAARDLGIDPNAVYMSRVKVNLIEEGTATNG